MSNRGNQITLEYHWIEKIKRDYERRNLSNEELRNIRDNIDKNENDSTKEAREKEIRKKAINNILDNNHV